MSENRPSDHSLGSEFYDGQIECIFTDPTNEDQLFAARSDFLAAAFARWGAKLAHLDDEVLNLAGTLSRPLHDSAKQRHAVSDLLNKVHLESLDNTKLGQVLADSGIEAKGTGTLKRLQALLESVDDKGQVHDLLSPFYILYDFRVAYSHLGSSSAEDRMKTVTDRLSLAGGAELFDVYDRLLAEMTAAYTALTALVQPASDTGPKSAP
jgi:hypothetical protein